MIVIPGKLSKGLIARGESKDAFFLCKDEEIYTLLDENFGRGVPGTLHRAEGQKEIPVSGIGKAGDRVRLIFYGLPAPSRSRRNRAPAKVKGYVLHGRRWKEVPVRTLPVKGEIFSRTAGLFETDAIASKKVLIIGLGSVGSHIAVELAKSGVMEFFLIDHDRLEVANVIRHDAGLSDVGRHKTKVMAERLKDKNPYVKIRTCEQKVSWTNIEQLRRIVQKVDIVVFATDNPESRLILNKVCVEQNKPFVSSGAFRRAYGVQILFWRSRKDPCYQCLRMSLPDQANDQEASDPGQAAGIAYSDRPVPIEPGLSTDILPVSIMTVKLVTQELLKGTETTLRSLDEDLVAPLYLWLNRREAGTQYQKLEPLEFNVDGLHILRWYGIDMKPNPACPVCGDFVGQMGKQDGPVLPDLRKLIGQPPKRISQWTIS